ncbi:MAG: hypothetical protein MHPSP_002231, partial [Paramarteilia canceri]
ITGASQGFGLSLAENLCRSGYKVTICARNEERLSEAVSKLEVLEGRIIGIPLDISECIEFSKLSSQQIQSMFGVNLTGATVFTRLAINYLNSEAQILFVSSLSAAIPVFGLGIYSVTKAALLTLVDVLNIELSAKNITARAIVPGDIDTPGYKKQLSQQSPITAIISSTVAPKTSDNLAKLVVPQILKKERANIYPGLVGKCLQISTDPVPEDSYIKCILFLLLVIPVKLLVSFVRKFHMNIVKKQAREDTES